MVQKIIVSAINEPAQKNQGPIQYLGGYYEFKILEWTDKVFLTWNKLNTTQPLTYPLRIQKNLCTEMLKLL